jgi:hypothetical protein
MQQTSFAQRFARRRASCTEGTAREASFVRRRVKFIGCFPRLAPFKAGGIFLPSVRATPSSVLGLEIAQPLERGDSAMAQKARCKHSECKCLTDDSSGYCSGSCSQRKIAEGKCSCGHLDCK